MCDVSLSLSHSLIRCRNEIWQHVRQRFPSASLLALERALKARATSHPTGGGGLPLPPLGDEVSTYSFTAPFA
jgi:hypothetical protein